jgi:putative N6-adenine-specific DNA methylase
VNLHLRSASRILVRLARFRALTFAELERRAKRIPWEKVLGEGQQVALRVTCRKSRLYHSDAVAERIERDLVARFGTSVAASTRDDDDTEHASEAQLIVVRFDRDNCTVSADSSGAHLHQRGYRTHVTTAPMRETLAAALILASEWDRRSPLLDPFCGSGTIPIEAALIAAKIAPGKNRRFQFMRWPGFDPVEWDRIHSAAVSREHRVAVPPIRGSDRTASAIRAAADNATRADVAELVEFSRADALDLTAGASAGWIVSNPPYGVRLGGAGAARRLLSDFGNRVRYQFGGWRLGLLVPAEVDRVSALDLAPRLLTTNGGLRVHLLTGTVPNAGTDTAH